MTKRPAEDISGSPDDRQPGRSPFTPQNTLEQPEEPQAGATKRARTETYQAPPDPPTPCPAPTQPILSTARPPSWRTFPPPSDQLHTRSMPTSPTSSTQYHPSPPSSEPSGPFLASPTSTRHSRRRTSSSDSHMSIDECSLDFAALDLAQRAPSSDADDQDTGGTRRRRVRWQTASSSPPSPAPAVHRRRTPTTSAYLYPPAQDENVSPPSYLNRRGQQNYPWHTSISGATEVGPSTDTGQPEPDPRPPFSIARRRFVELPPDPADSGPSVLPPARDRSIGLGLRLSRPGAWRNPTCMRL